MTTNSPSSGKLLVVRASIVCKPAGDQHPQWHHYCVRVIQGSLHSGAPAFAVANFSGSFRKVPQAIAADLEHNGVTEVFRSCTSAEGVHLTIWAGQPLEGQRKWHDYFYLGYDVDANCTTAETQAAAEAQTATRPE